MNMTWTWPGPCPISNFPLVFLSYSTCVFTIVLSVKLTVTQRWHESWRRRWRGGARHQVLWEPLKSDYTLCLKSPRTTDQTSLCLKSTRRQTRHYSRLSYCVSVCLWECVCVSMSASVKLRTRHVDLFTWVRRANRAEGEWSEEEGKESGRGGYRKSSVSVSTGDEAEVSKTNGEWSKGTTVG